MLHFSQQKDGGQGYDYIAHFYDNAACGDCGAGNPAFLGACEVCIWPGLVLGLPAAVCFGGYVRIVQSSVAANPDRRAVIWRNVSKSDLGGAH